MLSRFFMQRFRCSFVIAFLAVVCLPIASQTETNSLYGPDDKVVILNATNIKQHVYGSSRAWLVEFYSSWCGHCIHFAPTWKAFAENVSGWSTAVAIAGVDCADENNIQTCREYEIMGYPTLVMFPPHAKPTIDDEDGKPILNRGSRFKRSEMIGDLRRELLTNLTQMYPKLFQLPTRTITADENQFWTDSHIENQISFVLLVFEGQSSSIGKELTLLLSEFPSIQVLRFNKRNPMYSQLKLEGWPAIGYVKRGVMSGSIGFKKNLNLVDALKKDVIKLAELSISDASTSVIVKVKEIENVFQTKTETDVNAKQVKEDKVSMEDLIHAVRNSLHNEIGLIKKFSGSKLAAVKNYISILNQLFPADRREIKLFFLKLENWLEPQNEIQDQVYLDKLTELEVELHPWEIDISTWIDCKGSSPGRRGYTCGLWRLFHTLTVIGIEKQLDIKVLDAIHGYVKEIFGCTECSQHFVEMVSKDNALFIKPIKEQALWLWRAHNKVNIKLKGSASEDPKYPKQLYPSVRQCPKCFVGPGHYDEDKVVDYLFSVYSKAQRMIKNYSKDYLTADEALDERQHQKSASFFSLADIGIFMVVYISVVILLVLGYIHFRMVSKRRLDSYMLCRSRRLCSAMV